eukprot:6171276-Pyramimonas_sp.AAC.1
MSIIIHVFIRTHMPIIRSNTAMLLLLLPKGQNIRLEARSIIALNRANSTSNCRCIFWKAEPVGEQRIDRNLSTA